MEAYVQFLHAMFHPHPHPPPSRGRDLFSFPLPWWEGEGEGEMTRSGVIALVLSLGLHGAVLGWIAWEGWGPGKAPAGQILVLEVQVVPSAEEVQTESSRFAASKPRERIVRVHSEDPGKKAEEPVLSDDTVANYSLTARQERTEGAVQEVRPIAMALTSHGVGSPSPEQSAVRVGSDLEERLRAIRTRIERGKAYPPLARREGIEGTTTLAFRIREGGKIEGLRVIRSSGSSLLDEASLEAVRGAAPLPTVEGEIRVSLVFQLRTF
jgi:TonB family protein